MSSLLQRVKEGKFTNNPAVPVGVSVEVMSWIKNHELVPYNIQECADEIILPASVGDGTMFKVSGLKATPKRAACWLEFMAGMPGQLKTRFAWMVLTPELPKGESPTVFRCFLWGETFTNPRPAMPFMLEVFLASDGCVNRKDFYKPTYYGTGPLDNNNLMTVFLPLLHALFKMNAANVTTSTEPKARKHRGKRKEPLCSVWHTLDVEDKHINRGLGECQHGDIRLHWVNGHWRHLPGGNGQIWIKWYRRGNAELGEVVPSYDIKSSKIKAA